MITYLGDTNLYRAKLSLQGLEGVTRVQEPPIQAPTRYLAEEAPPEGGEVTPSGLRAESWDFYIFGEDAVRQVRYKKRKSRNGKASG